MRIPRLLSFFRNSMVAWNVVRGNPSESRPWSEMGGLGVDVGPHLHEFESRFRGRQLWLTLIMSVKSEIAVFFLLLLGSGAIAISIPYSLEAVFSAFENDVAARRLASLLLAFSLLVVLQVLLNWYMDYRERRLLLIVRHIVQRALFRRLQLVSEDAAVLEGRDATSFVTTFAPQITQVIYVVDFVATSVVIIVASALVIAWFGMAGIGVLVLLALFSAALQRLIVVIGRIYHQYLDKDHRRMSLVRLLAAELAKLKRQRLESIFRHALNRVRVEQGAVLRARAKWQSISRSAEEGLSSLVALVVVGLVWLGSGTVDASTILPIMVLAGTLVGAVENNLANMRVLRNTLGPTRAIEALFAENVPVRERHEPHGIISPPTLTIVDGLRGGPSVTGPVVFSAGSRIAIVGPTGAGKSTLLRQFARDSPSGGSLTVASTGSILFVDRNEPFYEELLAEQVVLWSRPVNEGK